MRRYRLLITAGDETGETDFILFGHMAQRIVKKPLDILIADNPAGFIPDEITRLMEKVYTFNVSFTDSTIALGNVCFQVNTVVAEIGDGGQVPISPSGSQPSSISSARAASKSTSADSVPTGGTSSQTPQSTKNYNKDKVTHAFEHSINLLLPPTQVALQTMHFDVACKVANATIKRWVLSYQAGCEENIGRLS